MTRAQGSHQLPSLDLLRQITDAHVLDQLLAEPELTRAEISARTGISKPTISESVRRLVLTGLLTESGQQLGRRGRAGTYFRLAEDAGVAVALSAGPDGMVAETCDLRGAVTSRVEHDVPGTVSSVELAPILFEAARAAVAAATGPVLAWALSLAGPVDQRTGRLVQLPNSPFLLDELNPRTLVAPLAPAELRVDNDVNWAALAELHEGSARDLRSFCYCYLGPGVGAALVENGVLVHGHGGLAGELAHVGTEGPGGASMKLVECFAAWELVQPGSSAIDVDRLVRLLEGQSASDRRLTRDVARAVAGALSSVTALLNPQAVVIGGPWAEAQGFAALVAEQLHEAAAVDAEVRTAHLDTGAPLTGARITAVRTAQQLLTRR